MSLSLPLPGHPARELIDVQALAQMVGDGSAKNFAKFPTLPEATRLAREFLAKETAARAVHYIDLRADFDGNHQRYFGRIFIEPQSDFTPLG